jgi:hypothetical protein
MMWVEPVDLSVAQLGAARRHRGAIRHSHEVAAHASDSEK